MSTSGLYIPGQETLNPRPGVFFNFTSQQQQVAKAALTGVTTLPLALSWGASGYSDINILTDTLPILGERDNIEVGLALRNAKTVKVYRLNDGNKATGTIGNLTITAKYGGVKGNTLRVVVDTNISGGFDVEVFFDTEKVFSQEGVSNVADLETSAYVDWSGSGALSENAGTTLSGGTDNAVVTQSWTNYINSLKITQFNIAACPSTDDGIKTAFVAEINRLVKTSGKWVRGVLANKAANTENILNVMSGYKKKDGTTISREQYVAYVAGLESSTLYNKSNTNHEMTDAIEPVPLLSDDDIKEALKRGEYILSLNDGKVQVEKDINSLTTFDRPLDFSYQSNRTIRTLYHIAKSLSSIVKPNKYDSEDDGDTLALADAVGFMSTMQDNKAIKNFQSSDIQVTAETAGESLYFDVYVQPVLSREKIYFRIYTEIK